MIKVTKDINHGEDIRWLIRTYKMHTRNFKAPKIACYDTETNKGTQKGHQQTPQ
jgi:hypothetical protein